MTTLGQIVAIEKNVRNGTQARWDDLYKEVQRRGNLTGIIETYEPVQIEGELQVKYPDKREKVKINAEEFLDDARNLLTRFFDVTATRDYGNTQARGDVILDDEVIWENVPATHLLFLENQLAHLHTVISAIPTLPVGQDWHPDTEAGMYRTDARTRPQMKKATRFKTAPATDKHQEALLATYQDDVPAGEWTTVDLSGALDPKRARRVLENITRLREAVKFARIQANGTAVQDVKEGSTLFDIIFAR